MSELTATEIAERKKAIFDGMGPRNQKKILNQGYDKWNPFAEPNDPIDMRKDKTNRTSQMLIREFLQNSKDEDYSNEYGRGAFDICLGIINKDERYRGMYDFSCWYKEVLEKENL